MKKELKEDLKKSELILKISVIKIVLISAFIVIYFFNLDTIIDFIYMMTNGHKILTMIGGGFYILIFICALIMFGFQLTSYDYYNKKYLDYKNKIKQL